MDRSRLLQRFRFYLKVAAAWTALWLITYLAHPETFFIFLKNEIWRNIYILAVNFFFFEFVWEYIKLKRRFLIINIILGIFFLFILMLFMSFGLFAWRQLGIALGIHINMLEDDSISKAIALQTQNGFISLVFFGFIKHIYDYRQLALSAQQLRIEKQQAELSYLKSQTNPHFLFNTLNNIYSLARDKSDRAPESILRLSKILRFMLYETGGSSITIEQELKIIDDYIALEKLRYDESLDVRFSANVENPKQPVPPLLMIPLVENAFKHGVSETRGSAFIDISLEVRGKQLRFVVKNSSEKEDAHQPIKENIGLSNLRRQLQLLYKDHDLSVAQTGSVFTVVLTINLASYVNDHMHHRRR